MQCNHSGIVNYVRRQLPNGSVHICAQCADCGELILLDQHKRRPFIRLDEVPSGVLIGEWIERGVAA